MGNAHGICTGFEREWSHPFMGSFFETYCIYMYMYMYMYVDTHLLKSAHEGLAVETVDSFLALDTRRPLRVSELLRGL